MPKEVTVLGLEGSVLRGLRLEESGKEFAVAASETWSIAAASDLPEAPENQEVPKSPDVP